MGWDVATPLNATMILGDLDLLTPLSPLSYATAPPRHVVHQTRVTVLRRALLTEINTAVAASSATHWLILSMVIILVDAARAQVRHATRRGIAAILMGAAATTSAA